MQAGMQEFLSPGTRWRVGVSMFIVAVLAAWVAACGGGAGSGDRARAPIVVYTDALTGPTSGGENNQGAYLSIFGKNFGAPADLGARTKALIGNKEVANYRYLGPAKVAGKLGLQQLTVQVGALGGVGVGAHLPVQVVVDGVASQPGVTFTPSAGRILFVALNGSDASAVAGDIAKPWRYLQNMATRTGAYFAMQAGDHLVIRGGNWSDTNGVDTTWMRAGSAATARNGTADAWIHITAYPGPIKGNAIEDVHYTTPAGKSGGIAGPWSAIAGTSGEYWSISNLHMDVAGGAARDAAPLNLQYTAGPWRIVNNELGPWVAGTSAVLNAAGISGHGFGNQVLGNHIHHIEGTAELQNHGIYADSLSTDWEIAYNWIHDVSGGSLVQFNDNQGCAGQAVAVSACGAVPHAGGVWEGFTGMRVHHNWLENAAKYGINYNDQGSTQTGRYEGQHWNNVIIGTRMPPLRINATQPQQQLSFAFNTVYNCMTRTGGYSTMVMDEGVGSGPSIRNVFYNNVFAFGPGTAPDTVWLIDYSTPSTTASYDFRRNLYFVNGHAGAPSPATVGDILAVVGDPLFVNAAGGDFSLQAASPALDQGTQALPAGMAAVNDFTILSARPAGVAPDLGAFEKGLSTPP